MNQLTHKQNAGSESGRNDLKGGSLSADANLEVLPNGKLRVWDMTPMDIAIWGRIDARNNYRNVEAQYDGAHKRDSHVMRDCTHTTLVDP